MSKTTAKTTVFGENVEFPTFDASKATDQFRVFAEKGVEQSKEAYTKMKTGAETAQKALETTFETAKSAGSELSLKTLSTMRSNAELGFSHVEALMGVKSVSEFIELQTAFLRKQAEALAEQAKELQAVATTAAETVSKPVKDAVSKVMADLKVA